MGYVDTPEKRDSYIEGLREFADFLEDNPEFSMDWVGDYINVYCHTEEVFKSQVKALGGKREKEFTNFSLYVNRKFTDGFTVKLMTDRDNVCERRKVIPVSTAKMEVEVEEDIFETDCAIVLE